MLFEDNLIEFKHCNGCSAIVFKQKLYLLDPLGTEFIFILVEVLSLN